MPSFPLLLRNWWKQIVLMMVLALLTSGIIVYLKPAEYLSVATAVPASSFATDKARLFNNNIQQLYTALGSPDDLDIIVGTASLDTIYLAVTDQFNLWDHYKIPDRKDPAARKKAAAILKSKAKVMKSDYGELKVKAWDTDKALAPQLANALLNELQVLHQHLQNAGNESTMQGLISSRDKLARGLDSVNNADAKAKLQLRIDEYDKLAAEYRLVLDSKSPVLVTVEKAGIAETPDRPRKLQWMLAAAALAFVFSIFAAVVMEGRKAAKA